MDPPSRAGGFVVVETVCIWRCSVCPGFIEIYGRVASAYLRLHALWLDNDRLRYGWDSKEELGSLQPCLQPRDVALGDAPDRPRHRVVRAILAQLGRERVQDAGEGLGRLVALRGPGAQRAHDHGVHGLRQPGHQLARCGSDGEKAPVDLV